LQDGGKISTINSMKDFLLFSGTSNRPLGTLVAKQLGKKLSDIDITRFIDNECRVWIKEPDIDDKHIFVIQSLSQIADQNLVELCLIGQALKTLKARHVTAVIPWLGYSKQDKEFRKGEAVSAQLVAKFIEAAGFDQVITVELHSENLIPFFHIPVLELSTHELLTGCIRGDNGHVVVVSPDQGGMSRSDRFAKFANLPIVHLSKTRDLSTGKVTVNGIDGDVKGKTVVIFDDIINTGATAIRSADFLKQEGAASIIFLATHAALAGDAGEQLEKSPIDRVAVTDTIAIPKQKRFSKLTIISVATLLADAIKTIVR